MALRMFNGTDLDTFMGSPSLTTATNTNLTNAYQAGVALTAPNTTNYITGVLCFINSVPSGAAGDLQVEVRESGSSVVSGVANNADLTVGFNYIRFTTPYQFTTTGAGAYVPYVKMTVLSSGSVGRDNASAVPCLAVTYDATGSPGATDDVMVCGFHDSGLTPQTWTLTGTGNSWGSGQNKNPTPTSTRLWNQATAIGNGGTLKFDTAADCTLTQYGNIGVFKDGVFDMRPGASSVSTLRFTNDADGDFALMTSSGAYGGQLFTTGQTVAVAATYNGGVGTAADPATFTAAHGFAVDDELVIGWGGDYLKNEVRYVISIPNPDEVVWSTTAGGAESALTHTHTTGKPVANLTRNSIIENTDSSKGFSVYNNSSTSPSSDFAYTRFDHANCLSGRTLQLSSLYTTTGGDGLVLYSNSASGRTSISWSGSIVETVQDIVLFNTKGSNYSAQSGIALAGASSKTLRNVYHYGEPGSTNNCGGISISGSSTSCVVDGFYSSGANAGNGNGYALGVYGSGNSFNNIVIDGCRRQAVILDAGQQNEFTNSSFGTVMTNTIDLTVSPGVLTRSNFLSCSFGSATLLSGYLTALPGTDIGFQDMDSSTSKHRWYTNTGSFWSSGSGLTDTTTRTAGSLALAIKPENASTGASVIVKVPANPTSQVQVYGYLYRNATFSSGDLTVDLFLPGTLLTDTPDDTVTLATTTGTWLPFLVNAYYSGSAARYATLRITAKTATTGAYCFLDDIYDAQTGNKVAGLDLWDAGHISPILVASDYSSIPDQTRVAVWGDTSTYSVGAKGRTLTDTEANTDVTQAKVNQL